MTEISPSLYNVPSGLDRGRVTYNSEWWKSLMYAPPVPRLFTSPQPSPITRLGAGEMSPPPPRRASPPCQHGDGNMTVPAAPYTYPDPYPYPNIGPFPGRTYVETYPDSGYHNYAYPQFYGYPDLTPEPYLFPQPAPFVIPLVGEEDGEEEEDDNCDETYRPDPYPRPVHTLKPYTRQNSVGAGTGCGCGK